MRQAQSLSALSLGLLILCVTTAHTSACTTESQPNPIVATYPQLTTGTVNGTIAILPISYALARSIIPSEYGILVQSYREWLPWWPADLYPFCGQAMLQTELDHDVYSAGKQIPDFSRASISSPFVDRLNDNYTAMAYGNEIFTSASNTLALEGTELYGNTVTLGSFDPPCDAYSYVHEPSNDDAVYFKAFTVTNGSIAKTAGIAWEMTPLHWHEESPYSMDFWLNITSLPQFSNNLSYCDNYIRLFNTSVSQPPYQPTPMRGTVTALQPYFSKSTVWSNVFGLRVDNAFIENNYLACESLQGYHVADARPERGRKGWK